MTASYHFCNVSSVQHNNHKTNESGVKNKSNNNKKQYFQRYIYRNPNKTNKSERKHKGITP